MVMTRTQSSTPAWSEQRSPETWHTLLYVAAIAVLTAITASGMSGWRLAVLFLCAALAVLGALVRVRYPYALVAVAWVTAAFLTQILLLPALFHIGVRRRGWRGLVVVTVTILMLVLVAGRGERIVSIDGVDPDRWTGFSGVVLNAAAVAVLPYVIGTVVASRRDLTESYRLRAEYAEAERAARAAEAVLLERARIANEAHDVLGHKLSLLTMQAGGLALNADAGERVVAEKAELIARSARDALDDLRSILGSLDTPSTPEATGPSRSLLPQDLAGIRSLVSGSRSSGAIVHVDTSRLGDPDHLPAPVSRAAYRIVQECLTNAHRHSPDAPVIISLSGAPGHELVIDVRNALTQPSAVRDDPRSGRGLPGLHERARSVGGSLSVTDSDSVFIVTGRLPWPDVRAEETMP